MLAELAFSLHSLYGTVGATDQSIIDKLDAEVTKVLSDLHFQFEQVSEALMLKLNPIEQGSNQGQDLKNDQLR